MEEKLLWVRYKKGQKERFVYNGERTKRITLVFRYSTQKLKNK